MTDSMAQINLIVHLNRLLHNIKNQQRRGINQTVKKGIDVGSVAV